MEFHNWLNGEEEFWFGHYILSEKQIQLVSLPDA